MTERLRTIQSFRSRTLLLGGFGLTLLANPVYLDELSVFPGVGWAELPLFAAAITTLGIVCFASIRIDCLDTAHSVRTVLGTTILVPVGYAGYELLLLFVYVGATAQLEGFFYKQLFVSSLIAGAFAAGVLVTLKKRFGPAGLLITMPFFVIAVIDWRFHPPLEPVLDFYFFFTSGVLLGIPYLGALFVVGVFLLGLVTGR